MGRFDRDNQFMILAWHFCSCETQRVMRKRKMPEGPSEVETLTQIRDELQKRG